MKPLALLLTLCLVPRAALADGAVFSSATAADKAKLAAYETTRAQALA